MRRLLACALALLFPLAAIAAEPAPHVRLSTTAGDIVLELDAAKAPATVDNFLAYVDSGFYIGTIFHRVKPDFMIQGGGYTAAYQKKDTRAPISNEASNGLKNLRGSIAMARTSDPNSATAQFFINVVDNPFLDYRGDNPRDIGYAVFGKVVSGMDAVDKIRNTPTGAGGPFPTDVPQQTMSILKAERVPAAAPASK
jgi:cyclophilin family peptidyl-prolyl cis-trans isomerase